MGSLAQGQETQSRFVTLDSDERTPAQAFDVLRQNQQHIRADTAGGARRLDEVE